MQTLTLKIQDDILEKVMLFLNDFSKDDVKIIKNIQNSSDKDYMKLLRDRHIKIDEQLEINEITDEMNSGLS